MAEGKEDIKTPPVSPNTEDNSIIPEVNYTDPFVYHDGGPIGSHIAKPLNPQNAIMFDEEGNFGSNVDYQSTKVEGIYQPIVKLNNIVLDEWQIENLVLHYDSFYPEIDIKVLYSDASFIEFNDAPGMNNVITVIIIPAVDGAYRKIAIDFTIIDYERNGNEYNIHGRVKWLPLEQQRCKHIHYCDHPPGPCPPTGCPNVKGKSGANGESATGTIECNHAHQKKPNTWEYLHEIALQCGLGFSATDQCREINDRLPRLVSSVSYLDFIQDQIRFGGLDENSIFDVWLDLYGYITMVNVPWVMSNDITYRHLTMKTFTGIRSKSIDMKDLEIQEVHRTLTNFNKMSTKSNNEIEHYNWVTNNFAINNTGTLQTLHSFTPQGVQDGNNSISCEQAQIIENSIDGAHVEDYEKSISLCTVVEVNEYNINNQRMIRDQYFKKLTSKMLRVDLLYPNLSIQRGTLINLSILESDPTRKRKLLTESDNIDGDNGTDMKNPEWEGNNKDIIQDEGEMVPNTAISGLYYVQGMRFTYHTYDNEYESMDSEKDIRQSLLLIKKGPITNIDNQYTSVKADEFALGAKTDVEPNIPGLTPHF